MIAGHVSGDWPRLPTYLSWGCGAAESAQARRSVRATLARHDDARALHDPELEKFDQDTATAQLTRRSNANRAHSARSGGVWLTADSMWARIEREEQGNQSLMSTRIGHSAVPAHEFRDGRLPAIRVAQPTAGSEQQLELELSDVSKEFQGRHGTVKALQDVSLSVKPHEFVAVLGRSGCGKTTLLRMLAGLTCPTRGRVLAAGRPLWTHGAPDCETVRKLGIVFQDAHLFPWYTVEQNIALPLTLRGIAKSERLARARELCKLLGLSSFERSYPRALSGGMRQRVAIARALSDRPSVLLMDEPFSGLDALTRDKMNLELQALAAASEAAVVFVTHSIREAVFLADRVVLLSPRPGRIRSITAVDFSRPRQLDLEAEPRFQQLVMNLRAQLDEET